MTDGSPYRTCAAAEQAPAPSLGRLLSTHRAPTFWSRVKVPFALVSAVMLMPLAVCFQKGSNPWIAISLLPLFFTLVVIAVAQRAKGGFRILLHEEGIVIEGPRRRDVVSFDDVDELWLKLRFVEMPGVGGYAGVLGARVVRHDQTTCDVPLGVEDGVRLTNVLTRRCSSHLLPDARAALRAGKTLHFGKVRLDKDGLTIRGSRFRWDDLRFVRLESGRITLVPRAFFRFSKALSLDDFPHPVVLLTLVRELCPRIKVEKILFEEA
jgi:hypothetical protein